MSTWDIGNRGAKIAKGLLFYIIVGSGCILVSNKYDAADGVVLASP